MSAGLSNFPCPRCGASLDVDGSTLTPRCPYCGADLILEAERVEHSPHLRWELIVDVNDDER